MTEKPNSQQLYLEYQTLNEQLKKVQRYLEQARGSIEELTKLIEDLDRFNALEEGAHIHAPIANGIFVDATLRNTRLKMNVGGGVVVDKSVEEAQEMLAKQRKDLEELRDRALKDQEQLMTRIRQIEAAVE